MTRKIISGKYLVETENAYFHWEYFSIEDVNANKGLMVHVPEKLSQTLFVSIKIKEDCIKFLRGNIIGEVKTRPLDDYMYPKKARLKTITLPRPVYAAMYKKIKNSTFSDKFVFGIKPSTNKDKILKEIETYSDGRKRIKLIKLKKFNKKIFYKE